MKTRLNYELCRLAYWAVLVLPHTSRLWLALLPYAGAFAYSEGYRGFVDGRKALEEAE